MAPLRFTLERDPRCFETLTPQVESFLKDRKVSEQAVYAVHLALEEVILNLIRHAKNGGPENRIGVTLALEDADVVIRIEDAGRPFDPRDASEFDPDQPLAERSTGGMGIHLVRNFVDDLQYESTDGRNLLTLRIRAGEAAS